MPHFLDALRSGRVLLMDGAMGTELRRAGLREGECGEAWNLTQPERVLAIHQAYVKAGAECLLTNTFQANPGALAKFGFADRLEAINEAAVNLARRAAGPGQFVLADIGPFDARTPTAAVASMIRSLGSADGLLLETCSDVANLVELVRLLQGGAVPPIPILFSATYARGARGLLTWGDGDSPRVFARKVLDQGEVDALGVNCGRDLGIHDAAEAVRQYREVTDLPLFARPNAGTPTRAAEDWVYPHRPDQMAAGLPDLLEAGVSMVGGCCGTTPEHIAAFRPVVEQWNAKRVPEGPAP